MNDARTLTLSVRGHWYGRYGTASCPINQPEGRVEQNFLTIGDGRNGLLLKSKKSGCSFRDIVVALGIRPGAFTQPSPATTARRTFNQHAEAEKRARQARMLWDEAEPIQGSIAEVYLRRRGITCVLPETLRFHRECWHPTARRIPAIIAVVDGVGRFAVHRTYLGPDGKGKAETVPTKAMLGAVQGGAVRLTRGDGPLVVAEGIETALSLASGLLPEPATVWAALSTSGMRALELPADAGRMTVAADGDVPGRAAAVALAERAHALGWHVRLLEPGDGCD